MKWIKNLAVFVFLLFGSFAHAQTSTVSNTPLTTCTPTVTLSGAGTVPVYATNSCYYQKDGKKITQWVRLTGDGGNEGSGAVQMRVALAATPSSNWASGYGPIGYGYNNVTEFLVFGDIDAGGTYVALNYMNLISTTTTLTADVQNNATRELWLILEYFVD